ncbi:MAG TPA: hypothetical protein V6D19_14325 [Stenomitos sp.]
MTEWQFLIRKAEDADWLPLESPNVEILEGRYHLVAEITSPAAAVEVQIRHEYEQNGVVQEVIQRRRQQPNSQGRLELLPLTYFAPGVWEFRCQAMLNGSDVVQHGTAKVPSGKLHLQVLAQEFESIFDWEPQPSSAMLGTMASPTVSTDKATSERSQTNTVPASVQPILLPVLPQDLPQIRFSQSEGPFLPPQIDPAPQIQSPQLPTFLPLNSDLFSGSEGSATPQNETIVSHLTFLRRIARSLDRHAVQTDFGGLTLQQRFLATLNQLAEPNVIPAQPQEVPL